MRPILIAVAALAVATPALAKPDPEEKAVLVVVQRFFDALGAQDSKTMQEVLLPTGVNTSVATQADGSTKVRQRAVADTWTSAIDPGLSERIWAPVVSRRGPMATVSAPYEFQKDGKTTHCGIDVFNLVKSDGAWKIASIMWTVEPGACAELKARK